MNKIEKYLNEGKNDYIVTSYGTIINIKNGYKFADENELTEIQKKFGKIAKECKIKIGRIDITPK